MDLANNEVFNFSISKLIIAIRNQQSNTFTGRKCKLFESQYSQDLGFELLVDFTSESQHLIRGHKLPMAIKVKEADQAINKRPLSASIPVKKRICPIGTTSPKPRDVKRTLEKYKYSIGSFTSFPSKTPSSKNSMEQANVTA
jgi:hypothetical protein